jgi:hypothetical protein
MCTLKPEGDGCLVGLVRNVPSKETIGGVSGGGGEAVVQRRSSVVKDWWHRLPPEENIASSRGQLAG